MAISIALVVMVRMATLYATSSKPYVTLILVLVGDDNNKEILATLGGMMVPSSN
jgi:hypothetical protein